MVEIKDVTSLLTLGAGMFVFAKVFPLVEGFLGGAGPAAAVAPAGPSDFEQYRQFQELQTIETRAAHQALAELLAVRGTERELFGPGLTEDIVYNGPQQIPLLTPTPDPAPAPYVAPYVAPSPYVAPYVAPSPYVAPAPAYVAPEPYIPPAPNVAPALPEIVNWAAGRVVGERTTGGVHYHTVATGTGKETERLRIG